MLKLIEADSPSGRREHLFHIALTVTNIMPFPSGAEHHSQHTNSSSGNSAGPQHVTSPPRDLRMSISPGTHSLLREQPHQTHCASEKHAGSSSEATRLATRRKAMLCALTKPSSQRGYVVCRLCKTLVWGPNGRYHIEKCVVLCRARQKAKEEGIKLVQVRDIAVDESVFKKPKSAIPKAAKVPGFVISRSVALENPHEAPNEFEKKRGVRTGRKGYVRCLACNGEVYAPNAKHHAAACPKRRGWSS